MRDSRCGVCSHNTIEGVMGDNKNITETAPAAGGDTQPRSGPSGGSPPAKRRKTGRKVPKQHRVGNFRSYYNYRLGHAAAGAVEEDPRLGALDEAWFASKRGLDVGCNSGNMTIAIGKRFSPSYILGVDVDPQLISRARNQLKDAIQTAQVKEAFQAITKTGDAGSFEDCGHPSKVNEGEDIASADTTENTVSGMPLSFQLWKPPVQTKTPKGVGKMVLGSKFPYNVVFKREDIVKDHHAGNGYDFITCFSVTKWIHLFHGDEGIRKLFRLFFDLLATDGRLILEPQPWKSYHKRKFTSDVTVANYGNIRLRPKDFPNFLVETIGFKKCTFLQVCQTSSKGFKRPIYLVEK